MAIVVWERHKVVVELRVAVRVWVQLKVDVVAVAKPHARARAVKVVREVQRLLGATGAQHRATLLVLSHQQRLLARAVEIVAMWHVHNHVLTLVAQDVTLLVEHRAIQPVQEDAIRVVWEPVKATAKS